MAEFEFREPGRLVDDDLELSLARKVPADPLKGYVPAYDFDMIREGATGPVGRLSLRIGTSEELIYPGHIGYEVGEPQRGQRFAARSCPVDTAIRSPAWSESGMADRGS